MPQAIVVPDLASFEALRKEVEAAEERRRAADRAARERAAAAVEVPKPPAQPHRARAVEFDLD